MYLLVSATLVNFGEIVEDHVIRYVCLFDRLAGGDTLLR